MFHLHRVLPALFCVLSSWAFAASSPMPIDRIEQFESARIISEEDIAPNRAAGYRLVTGELRNQEWVAPQANTTAD